MRWQNKPNLRPLAGNPKHEMLNPKEDERVRNDNTVYHIAEPARESAKMAQKLTFEYPEAAGRKKLTSSIKAC